MIEKAKMLLAGLAGVMFLTGCLSSPANHPMESEERSLWFDACEQAWEEYKVDWSAPPQENPPIEGGKECNVIAHETGNLYITNLNFSVVYNSFTLSAPVPNDEGSYDWVGIDDEKLTMTFWQNETKTSTTIIEKISMDEVDRVFAVKLDNDEIHVVVTGWSGYGIAGTNLERESVINHVWWQDENEVESEQLPGDFFFFDNTRLKTDGEVVVLAMPHHFIYGGLSRLYWTDSGSFEIQEFPGVELQFAVPSERDILACGTHTGNLYLYQQSTGWLPEFVTNVNPGVSICQITDTKHGSLITFAGVPLIGDSPIRDEYHIALKKNGVWEIYPMGMHLFNFADLTSVNGIPYHLHTTGAFGPDGEPAKSIEIRTPESSDFKGPWKKIWGGGAPEYFVDNDNKFSVGGSWWHIEDIGGKEVVFPLGVLQINHEPPIA